MSDGTGICQKTKKCTVLSTAPCLMCSANGFVTSPKHIPDFERIMKEIDYEMENCNDEHTREHYYSYKQVIARYIYELTLLERGE